MRYFKIPLCPKFGQCKRLKCPRGQKRLKLTQMQNQDDFVQNLTNKLRRQVEKDSKQMQGLKMGSSVGNDQNTLLYDFM